MESVTPNEMKLVLRLFKDVARDYNANNIAQEIGLSSMGSLKILKKLERQGILKSRQMGRAVFYKLDLESRLVKAFITFLLQKEAEESPPQVKKWVNEARKLQENAELALLFGSALKKGEPEDIDLIVILKQTQNKKINAAIREINEINVKRIHPLKQSREDLIENIRQGDQTILNALREGIVAFGYDKMVEVLSDATR